MIDPKRITIQKFNPEDMLRLRGDAPIIAANARLNQVSGPAYSLYFDRKLVACGGVRIAGVGEAWACYHSESLKHLGDVLRQSKNTIEQIIRDEHLWRLWSEMKVQDDKHKTFLKHMDFQEIQAFVR